MRLRACLSRRLFARSLSDSLMTTMDRLAGRGEGEMWTEAHRARHEARLKSMVSFGAVGQVAQWLERADPPRSGQATSYAAVVRALAWHLRVGGAGRSLPGGLVSWRTAYGWFRRWQEQGLFDALLRYVAKLRRRAGGRKAEPRLAVIDTQSVKSAFCVAKAPVVRRHGKLIRWRHREPSHPA